MDEFLWFIALVALVWCAALTLAVIALWLRWHNARVEALLHQMQLGLERVERNLNQVRSELDEERAQPVQSGSAPGATGQPIPQPVSLPAAAESRKSTRPPHDLQPASTLRSTPAPGFGMPEAARPPQKSNPELEALIGGNWLLKIGILAIVLGAVYFLKYAFDNQWIGNWGRVGIGLFAGLGMLGCGELFHKKGYPHYGQAVAAGGISILYLSIYAAFNFYALMALTPAFLCMAVITAACGMLAMRHQSKTLAVMGLLGGLLTPLWLSTGRNNETGLLGYLLILDLGTGILARSRNWYFLNAISLGGTVILFYLWAMRYYGPYALWTTEIFLILFTAAYLFLSWVPREKRAGHGAAFPQAELLMAVAVILFFVSSSSVLGPEPLYYWIFLLVFDAITLGVSLIVEREVLTPGVFLLNALSIAWWIPAYYDSSNRTLVFCLLSGIFLLFFAQQMLRRRILETSAGVSEVLVCMGTGVGYFGAGYYLMAPPYRRPMGVLALILAAAYLAAARFLQRSRETACPVSQAFIGISITMITLAIPIELNMQWITLGWAAEASVLTWIGFTTNSARFRRGGLAILALSLFRLIALDAPTRFLDYPLLFNARVLSFLGVIASVYLMAHLYRKYASALGQSESRVRTSLVLLASVLSVTIISIECWAYYGKSEHAIRSSLRDGRISRTDSLVETTRIAGLRQVMLSTLWSLYSISVVVTGIRFRFRPIRLFGIALFFLTVFKVFTVDIWSLERLYRIFSTITVGLILLGAAFLYQRFRKRVIET